MHARRLQPRRFRSGRSGRRFDSCIREDCNGRSSVDRVGTDQVLIHACARIATVIGDSCRHSAPFRFMYVRGLQPQTSRRANYMSDFDSCMREDCNREGELLPGVDCILIHACARIATAFISLLSPSTSDFDSCMCEDCNRILDTFGIGRSVFQFMHARGLQRAYKTCRSR